MTKKLGLFFIFYILVVQPSLVGYLWCDSSFYILAGFNTGVFLIAIAISCLGNNTNNNLKTDKDIELSETTKEINEDKEKTEKDQQSKETIEEKNEIKIQKESVSIPKIVQPISGHNIQKNKKKVYKKTGQRRVLLITLALAGILARPLWEIFGVRSVVISLIIGWLFYVIIGKIADLNGFERIRTLCSNWLYWILIIGGVAYGINYLYSNGQTIEALIPSDLGTRIEKYVKNWFNMEKIEDEKLSENENIYIFEGTGEVIINEDQNIENILNESLSGDNELSNNESNIAEENISAGITSNLPSLQETNNTPDKNQQLTMGEALKLLLSTSTLSTSKKTVFAYVPTNSELYPYFQTAYERKMIGKNTEPDKLISCETYITIKGILEGRYVGSYSDIKSAYWTKAQELGKLHGCEKGKTLTRGNL